LPFLYRNGKSEPEVFRRSFAEFSGEPAGFDETTGLTMQIGHQRESAEIGIDPMTIAATVRSGPIIGFFQTAHGSSKIQA